jgi:hypothetical protein
VKKNALLFLLIGAGAAFVFFRKSKSKRKRKGLVSVESPTKISEQQFNEAIPDDEKELRKLGNVLKNRSGKIIQYRKKYDHPNFF